MLSNRIHNKQNHEVDFLSHIFNQNWMMQNIQNTCLAQKKNDIQFSKLCFIV